MYSLLVKTSLNERVDFDDKTIGIHKEDFEISKNLGLLEDDEFTLMIEKEEDFINEREKFIDELYISESDSLMKYECIYTDETYKDIPVRITRIEKNQAFGLINNITSVYIPKNFISKLVVGELVSMDILYKEDENHINTWKCIKINDKCEPVLIYKYLYEKEDAIYTEQKYIVPLQDIGFIIGNNGNNIKTIIKNYLKKNSSEIILFNNCEDSETKFKESFSEWYNDANIPSINIENNNFTEITIYYEVKKNIMDKLNFNPIKDFIMKLYY